MRLVASLPPQQARALEDEAEAAPAAGARGAQAKRALLAAMFRTAQERKVDLFEINHRAWREPRAGEEAIA
jgi:hypothetical protein